MAYRSRKLKELIEGEDAYSVFYELQGISKAQWMRLSRDWRERSIDSLHEVLENEELTMAEEYDYDGEDTIARVAELMTKFDQWSSDHETREKRLQRIIWAALDAVGIEAIDEDQMKRAMRQVKAALR